MNPERKRGTHRFTSLSDIFTNYSKRHGGAIALYSEEVQKLNQEHNALKQKEKARQIDEESPEKTLGISL